GAEVTVDRDELRIRNPRRGDRALEHRPQLARHARANLRHRLRVAFGQLFSERDEIRRLDPVHRASVPDIARGYFFFTDSTNTYSCCASRMVSVFFPFFSPSTNVSPMLPVAMVTMENVPSSFLRLPIGLFQPPPKSNVVDLPSVTTSISPSASLT